MKHMICKTSIYEGALADREKKQKTYKGDCMNSFEYSTNCKIRIAMECFYSYSYSFHIWPKWDKKKKYTYFMEKSEAFKNRSRIILWDLKLIFVISTQESAIWTVLNICQNYKTWLDNGQWILYNQHTHTHNTHTHTHTPSDCIIWFRCVSLIILICQCI